MDLNRPARAISLFSGGLDSQLAVCVLREQGIDARAIVFESPFFDADTARKYAGSLGLELRVVDFSRDIISILRNPKHGFGQCLNPCIDCHARMLLRACEMLEEEGADFVCTGEVLGQRPMSQSMEGLRLVDKESGCPGMVVRPLSAKLLDETIPERNGWVDRSKLLSLEGRGRKSQFELAEKYGISDYPAPAGGCRLTEPNYCRRLKDLMDHEGLNGTRSLDLLRFGRHFRLADNVKVIVGRNENDNFMLEGNAELYDLIIKVEDVPGPTALLPLHATEEQIRLAAGICARYSDGDKTGEMDVRVRSARGTRKVRTVPADPGQVDKLRVL